MLTKTDLSQLSGVVNKAIENQVPKIVGNMIDAKVPKIIEKQLQPIKKDIRKIKEDLKLVTNYFDQNYLSHDIRITHLEKHVGLNSSHLS